MADGRGPVPRLRGRVPAGALPVFLVPASSRTSRTTATVFEWLMALCGVRRARGGRARGLGGSARLRDARASSRSAPLALGSVILTRFDLWPATLASFALAALVHDRLRLGHVLLGASVAAKLYPAVSLPLARRVRVAAARPAGGARLRRARVRRRARRLSPVPRARRPGGRATASGASCRGRSRSRASARRCCSPRTISRDSASRSARATARRTSPARRADVLAVAALGRAGRGARRGSGSRFARGATPTRERLVPLCRGGRGRVRRAREGALAAVPDLARPARAARARPPRVAAIGCSWRRSCSRSSGSRSATGTSRASSTRGSRGSCSRATSSLVALAR